MDGGLEAGPRLGLVFGRDEVTDDAEAAGEVRRLVAAVIKQDGLIHRKASAG